MRKQAVYSADLGVKGETVGDRFARGGGEDTGVTFLREYGERAERYILYFEEERQSFKYFSNIVAFEILQGAELFNFAGEFRMLCPRGIVNWELLRYGL